MTKKEKPQISLAQKIDQLAKTDGPIADPTRAKEIAEMDEFGLHEFRELTGVGAGRYGIYVISEMGVGLGSDSDHLSDLTARQQHELELARRSLTLAFPCTPELFVDWYESTQGKVDEKEPDKSRAPSDFPLACGFRFVLERSNRTFLQDASRSAPKGKIVSAFQVKAVEAENWEWWDKRLRDPSNYGLEVARLQAGKKGRGNNPSYWSPLFVGSWLIEKQHMPRSAVLAAMSEHFPQIDCDNL